MALNYTGFGRFIVKYVVILRNDRSITNLVVVVYYRLSMCFVGNCFETNDENKNSSRFHPAVDPLPQSHGIPLVW